MTKGKRYTAAVKARSSEQMSIENAIDFVKQNAGAKFDETVELHVRLNVNPKQADQMVRGTVELPHGSPRQTRVAVFADDVKTQDSAKKAGADIVGGFELIDEVKKSGGLDADIAVATPEMMKELGKIAKILGPRGLMPNPRNNTISKDPAVVVKQLQGGVVHFKVDAAGNVHIAVAKVSWDKNHILENTRVAIDAIRSARPTGVKGEYVRNISVSSTMGPGVDVTK